MFPANNHSDPASRAIASVTLDVAYGIQIKSMDDEYIRLILDGVEIFNMSKVPGAFWVDLAPFLRHIPAWVPGAAAKKFSERYGPDVQRMRNQPFDMVKNGQVRFPLSRSQISDHTYQSIQTTNDSIALNVIKKLEGEYQHDRALKETEESNARDVTGIMYIGIEPSSCHSKPTDDVITKREPIRFVQITSSSSCYI